MFLEDKMKERKHPKLGTQPEENFGMEKVPNKRKGREGRWEVMAQTTLSFSKAVLI
jgi:hypothetical protein